jgi:hypothetical protein
MAAAIERDDQQIIYKHGNQQMNTETEQKTMKTETGNDTFEFFGSSEKIVG